MADYIPSERTLELAKMASKFTGESRDDIDKKINEKIISIKQEINIRDLKGIFETMGFFNKSIDSKIRRKECLKSILPLIGNINGAETLYSKLKSKQI